MFAMTKYALPHMKKGASYVFSTTICDVVVLLNPPPPPLKIRIINTTSVVAFRGTPEMVDYAATKGAIVSFTRALAKNLVPKGIRVNAVA